MGALIYKLNNDKNTEIKKSTQLQSQVSSLSGTVNTLQNKIDNISNITKNEVVKENQNAKNNEMKLNPILKKTMEIH